MQILVTKDDQQWGPYSKDEIMAYLRDGNFKTSDLAWQDGMVEWKPLFTLLGIPPAAPPQSALNSPARNSITGVTLWNPNTAANWSVLFSPAFGSLLHHLNWKALGDSKEARISLGWFIASAVFLLIAFASPDTAADGVRVVGIGLLVTWYFIHAKKQVAFVNKILGNSYQKKSFATPVLIGVAVLGVLVLPSLLGAPTLPKVDAPEVVAAVESAIQNSRALKLTEGLIGKVKIESPGEISYDPKKPRRVARAMLKTNLGTEIVYYSVEWQNADKQLMWVQIEDKP